jgi:hypothetical protein
MSRATAEASQQLAGRTFLVTHKDKASYLTSLYDSQILRRPRMSGATNLLICTNLRLTSLSSCSPIRYRPRVAARYPVKGNLVKLQSCVLLLRDISGSTITMYRYTYLDKDQDLYSGSELCRPIEPCVQYIPQAAHWLVKQTPTHLSGQTNDMHSPMFALSQTTCDGDRWKCSTVRKRHADVQN